MYHKHNTYIIEIIARYTNHSCALKDPCRPMKWLPCHLETIFIGCRRNNIQIWYFVYHIKFLPSVIMYLSQGQTLLLFSFSNRFFGSLYQSYCMYFKHNRAISIHYDFCVNNFFLKYSSSIFYSFHEPCFSIVLVSCHYNVFWYVFKNLCDSQINMQVKIRKIQNDYCCRVWHLNTVI